MALRATSKWGRMVMIGEGRRMEMNPSPDMIHDQKTLFGSWGTSTWHMMELVERLVRWNPHPPISSPAASRWRRSMKPGP